VETGTGSLIVLQRTERDSVLNLALEREMQRPVSSELIVLLLAY